MKKLTVIKPVQIGRLILRYFPFFCFAACVFLWWYYSVLLEEPRPGLGGLGIGLLLLTILACIYTISVFGGVTSLLAILGKKASGEGSKWMYSLLLLLNLLIGPASIHFLQLRIYYTTHPPLVRAVTGEKPQRVLALLETEEDPTTPSQEAVRAFQIAVDQSDYQSVNLFLVFFSDSDGASITRNAALNYAARYGRPALLEKLLKDGADPNSKLGSESALASAVKRGNQECIDLLLKGGADPRQTDSTEDILFHAIIKDDSQGASRWISYLDDSYFERESQKGSQFLHIALKRNRDLEIVKLLLEAGADPAEPSQRGSTPLAAAVTNNRAEAVRLFLNNGADPNDPRITENLIEIAEERNYFKVENILRQYGFSRTAEP